MSSDNEHIMVLGSNQGPTDTLTISILDAPDGLRDLQMTLSVNDQSYFIASNTLRVPLKEAHYMAEALVFLWKSSGLGRTTGS